MRLTEAEELQLRIVHRVRQLEEKGTAHLVHGTNPDDFV